MTERSKVNVLGAETSTLAVALRPSALAVIVVMPWPTAVTTPLADTVATRGSSTSQVTFLLVAFAGETVAIKVSVSPGLKYNLVLLSDTDETGMFVAVTVTVTDAVKPPSTVLTVMVAVPGAKASMPPTPSITAATLGLLLDHVTFLFVAF